jgi:hypothetical protein
MSFLPYYVVFFSLSLPIVHNLSLSHTYLSTLTPICSTDITSNLHESNSFAREVVMLSLETDGQSACVKPSRQVVSIFKHTLLIEQPERFAKQPTQA